MWFLEYNNFLSNLQTGFRAKRSTTDQLVCIEPLIQEVSIKKEHMVAIFINLEKAYDIWPYGMVKDLGLQGQLLIILKHFLENQTFHTQVNNTFSSYIVSAFSLD